MKIEFLVLLGLGIAPLTDAKCWSQFVGVGQKKWKLTTYKSTNCNDKTKTFQGKGFEGPRCLDIPNNTKSFIFSVGGGYVSPFQQCTIFFHTTDDCKGETVGRSTGDWKKSKLSKKGKKMKSATVQCLTFFGKREAEELGGRDRRFVRDDEGEWLEELEDGSLVEADVAEDEFDNLAE